MTDNELLLAISEMMDTKLKSELQPIKNDLQVVKDKVQIMENELQIVKDDLQVVKDDLQVVKDKVQTMENELRRVKLFQENVLVPRLDTIESCYTDTYNRYRNHADRMEAAFEDVELLKRVVTEHSERLQKIG